MTVCSIGSGGFPLFGVAIDVVDLVAAEGIGNAQRDGMAVDVVAGIDAIVVVESGGFSDVPTEGVAD